MAIPLQEQLRITSGSADEKFNLMNEYIERMLSGEVLEDSEVAILELLKNWAAENVVPVYMQAVAQGQGGM